MDINLKTHRGFNFTEALFTNNILRWLWDSLYWMSELFFFTIR